jgi:AcrR family transcriptional regulator
MAALQLFAERGFKGTTMKDIAKIVGVTEGAIYRHYSGKEEIVESLINRVIRDLSSRIEESVGRGKTIPDKIKLAIDTLTRYAFEKPDCFRYLNIYHLFKKNHRDRRRKFPGRILMELFREAYREGVITVKPELALCITVGTIERLFVFKEIGIIGKAKESLISELEDSILRAIGVKKGVVSKDVGL